MRRWGVLFPIGLLLAAAATVAAAPDKPKMVTGQVVSVDAATRILVVRNEVQGSAEEIRLTVAPDALVRLHGPKGKLEQIKPGDIVTVKYLAKDGRNTATEIQHM